MIDQLFEFVENHPLLVSAFLVVLLAWLAFEAKRGGASGVSTNEATSLINREDGVVIDIRESSEFKAGHIAGAKNVPQARLKERLTQIEKYKDTPVIVVCKQGQAAGAAVTELTQAGFSRVYKLKGGMAQWQADGLPVVRR
ncbi:rhodanese-like domain-containing protein [Salinicola sp. LHM]|jgi:rhodanese-related sulfurtransferase|uniref:rhodanese-like domain-containing protein n=1 Tax=Salinicola TaxID=404432 RepID=UPI0008DE696A|nr:MULTISPECIES: rhodanese-like domain-containing protein [Salinicola]MEC8917895.1 rhodanese-like domain-containing protein [Pseudomonadota bacterium]MDF3920177.1 rhodanese-like domain-containing protein [Salinicola salarius]MED5500038.1 rhodanese-like domain-containing protein [Pseudomonadota bacterium]OHY99581.1 sulfurtransferase [Salinicola sp. MIT1003]WQH33173.1 rhodanese-like domain-containing protein [Salinicola sp. LHM]